jgi:transposase
MLIVPAGVKVHLALGYTDMRKGMDGLAILVQETLKKDPFSGHLFAFRGKKASMLKAGDGGLRRLDHADPGAARDADRRHRLARAGARLEACDRRLNCRNLHRI